jgi:hypothetical protein
MVAAGLTPVLPSMSCGFFVSQWDTRARVSVPYRMIQLAVNPFKPWS